MDIVRGDVKVAGVISPHFLPVFFFVCLFTAS